ncbi:MAG TPA: exodeoxyribonuclease VII large subunit [Solirubrobacterales bacterium]|nr:exodeoxyribonuclease VII large subunit [Solirubrobacterales bacterium]
MDLPGPFAVGRYARTLREELRKRARVQLIGEITGLRHTQKQSYFELRDAEGAVPCTIWANELAALELPEGALRDGAEFVAVGGPDYFIGSAASSPAFSFRVTHLRLAGEGDLLARLEALRKQLRSEGLFELQKQLARPRLPRTIGVVTAERGAARRDLLAGLERRGWAGRVIWAFAPVQDRRAAPAIGAAIQDLAATPEVETIVVTRGGGSLADLWAFCDETLCRTVAMLRVPVISAVGHERDSTLIDDVAAVACSTPTHAAEAAVPLDCNAAREALGRDAVGLRRAAERAVGSRSRHLVSLARGPARALRRERGALNQKTREIRAASERGLAERRAFQRRLATVVLARAARRAAGAEADSSREALHRAAVALRAHEPERTLERGYALAEAPDGEPLTSAAAARAADEINLRFSDGRIRVREA